MHGRAVAGRDLSEDNERMRIIKTIRSLPLNAVLTREWREHGWRRKVKGSRFFPDNRVPAAAREVLLDQRNDILAELPIFQRLHALLGTGLDFGRNADRRSPYLLSHHRGCIVVCCWCSRIHDWTRAEKPDGRAHNFFVWSFSHSFTGRIILPHNKKQHKYEK